LQKRTWEEHIIKDRVRWFLKGQFSKVIETLKNPDDILQSPSKDNTAAYVRKFDDLYIFNTVMARAYLCVLVNLNNFRIRTVYDSRKLKDWKRIGPKK
jgi:hypothetical protein